MPNDLTLNPYLLMTGSHTMHWKDASEEERFCAPCQSTVFIPYVQSNS
jgi:hypothetical protein